MECGLLVPSTLLAASGRRLRTAGTGASATFAAKAQAGASKIKKQENERD
jgi:hypothetical protein